MTIQAVFLDFGNTLARERVARHAIYAEAARPHAPATSPARMRELMQRAYRELPIEIGGHWRFTDGWFDAYIERIFHRYLGLDRDCLPAVSAELFARFRDPATYEFFPGAVELVAELVLRGLRVGLISNWSPHLAGILSGLGGLERLDPLLCSAIERLEKPEPELFRRALERAGIEPGDAIHAGDHLENDYHGALAVGMRAVLVDHERALSGVADTSHSPVIRVDSLFALKEHLLDLLS
jgi:HAD superfamily hydrolase (TIGR01549 family)